MDRFLRRLLTPLFAALFVAGLTVPAASATAEIPLRLLAPAGGAVLQAGATATLEWAPLADPAGQERWEEWEAFFSLDGGATYPFRVTPHLDRELRRVTFKVPRFPTRNGRLLLRVGDERRELAFELPQRFTIAVPPESRGSWLDFHPTTLRRGEPARPGEPGVLAWVEGSRQGGPTREVAAAEPTRAVPGLSFPPGTEAPAVVAAEAPPSGAPAADSSVRSALPLPRAVSTAGARAPLPATTDLLLLLTRRNE
jgi:hypothetical protein